MVAPAVFGDFLAAGRRHLEAAVAAGEPGAAALPAAVPSVHRLVVTMSLCLEDLAPCDEIEAAGRTDLHVWERAVADSGAAVRIAADCLHHSHLELGPAGPARRACSARARYLDAAATELAAGRDLLHTHLTRAPDGLARERSDWAPVVTSLPVTRALAAEMAAWSVRLALFTTWLAGLAQPEVFLRLADQPFVMSARGELASASQWLLAAGAALRPAHDADPVRAADADLLAAIPAAVPPTTPAAGRRGGIGRRTVRRDHRQRVPAARNRASRPGPGPMVAGRDLRCVAVDGPGRGHHRPAQRTRAEVAGRTGGPAPCPAGDSSPAAGRG